MLSITPPHGIYYVLGKLLCRAIEPRQINGFDKNNYDSIYYVDKLGIASLLECIIEREREESVTLVFHPCTKFGNLKHANMSDSACGQLSMCSHTLSCFDGSVTSTIEWGVD